MPWAKLDDGAHSHPKIVTAGNAAVGAWARMISYCGCYLTDGRVARSVALAFCSGPEVLARLVAFRLVDDDGGEFVAVHDYLDYNPSAAEVAASKEAKRSAGRRGGRASVQSRGQAPAQADAQAPAQAESKQSPVPSRPVPSDPGSTREDREVGAAPEASAAPQPTPSDSGSTPPPAGRTATSTGAGNGKARADKATVEAIMEHWRSTLGHPKAILDRKREAAIRRALGVYGEDGCREAIDGCVRSDWHTGRDSKGDGKRYDDPTLIFRDAAHVEGFRDLARGGAGTVKRPRPVRLCERCGKPIGDRESFVEGCHNACYYAPRPAVEVPA